VKQKVEAGEATDVVLVQPDFADELAKSGKISVEDRPAIGRVGIGLGARSDSPERKKSERYRPLLHGQQGPRLRRGAGLHRDTVPLCAVIRCRFAA
jgi:hypothetical protein